MGSDRMKQLKKQFPEQRKALTTHLPKSDRCVQYLVDRENHRFFKSLLERFKESRSRRREEAETLVLLPPRYLGGYGFLKLR